MHALHDHVDASLPVEVEDQDLEQLWGDLFLGQRMLRVSLLQEVSGRGVLELPEGCRGVGLMLDLLQDFAKVRHRDLQALHLDDDAAAASLDDAVGAPADLLHVKAHHFILFIVVAAKDIGKVFMESVQVDES